MPDNSPECRATKRRCPTYQTIEHIKGLDDLYQNLKILSQDLAFTFKLEILETKRFDYAKNIAEQFEMEFIGKFFGSNKDIQDFSYWLLRHGKRDVAKELNRVVVVLGSNLAANNVIKTIVKKYRLDDYELPSTSFSKTDAGALALMLYLVAGTLMLMWISSWHT